MEFNFILFYLIFLIIKGVFSYTTNSPVFCLLGETCKLTIMKENTEIWDSNINEECQSKDNEDVCSFTYDTNNGSSIYTFNNFTFNVIIFTLNNENNRLNIVIQNYSKLNDMKILAIIGEEEEENVDNNITMKEQYDNLEGYLTFSIIESDSEIMGIMEKKNPDSGEIYLPLINDILYFPNLISKYEEINTTFKLVIQTYNIINSNHLKSFVISNFSEEFEEFSIEEDEEEKILYSYLLNTIRISTFPPSNDELNFILQYNLFFTNTQFLNLILYPFDIAINQSLFLIDSSKIINVNFITTLDNNKIDEDWKFCLAKDKEIMEKSINFSPPNLLNIIYNEFGNYVVYVEYIDYYIKTSANISIIYRIQFDERINKNERFLSPHNVTLVFKNTILKEYINVSLFKDNNSETIITDYSLNNDGKQFSLNNEITDSGNYTIIIKNNYLSSDKQLYNFTIYEAIKLEKKYISLNNNISIIYLTDLKDILLNDKSIDIIKNLSNSYISFTISEIGLNKISFELMNGSIYDVGEIYAIPQNYFNLNYLKCITGLQIPNDFEIQIETDNLITEDKDINVSDLYYSYQKDGEKEEENKFPENFKFSIPSEINAKYLIKIYEKNGDIFFRENIDAPIFTNYNIITPLFKSSIIFYNISCKLDNLFAINNTTEGNLTIKCPTEVINNYLNCSITNNFTEYGNYNITYKNFILGEYFISGDLTKDDPEFIFNENILKENKSIEYTLKGNLFDINQLDYIIINDNSISNFSYNETNNSKSFSLQLKKGVYQITIFRKIPIIPSINNNKVSVVNSIVISIPLEFTLNSINNKWFRVDNSNKSALVISIGQDCELKSNYNLSLISEKQKITINKSEIIALEERYLIVIQNYPTGIYKILLEKNETKESCVTKDVVILSNNPQPEFNIYPNFIVFFNDTSEITIYISKESKYHEIIGIKCISNPYFFPFGEHHETNITLYKNDTCYYYTKYGDEEFLVSSIKFNIFDYYNQFLIFNGDITINQCYYTDDMEKPQLIFTKPPAIPIDEDEYFNYVNSLHINLVSKDNVKFQFLPKSKTGSNNNFTITEELYEGNYNLIIQDYFDNYLCNISNYIITNAEFDLFGSINYLTRTTTYIVKNLLCPLTFSICDYKESKQSCSINSTLVNNRYQETIICQNLNYENYYLHIQNHKAIEFPLIFYRTIISDPEISFSIIKPNSLELIEGIENEIQIKSVEYYVDYIKTITIAKEPIIENSGEDIEYIIFDTSNSKNKISFIAGDYVYFTINSPKENYKYKIISIKDQNNNIKQFSDDDSLILNVASCSLIHNQYFLKDESDEIKIISCKNKILLNQILESWNYLYPTNNLPTGFKLCKIKNNDLYCYLDSGIIPITITIEFFDRQYEVKFNSYEITKLCIYMPNDDRIKIKLNGENGEKYVLSYSGVTIPVTIDSNKEFEFEQLNVAYSPIKIIVNDISLDDTIVLYSKLNIRNGINGADKDNNKYFVYLKISDNSFELDNNNMIFTLTNENNTIKVNNTSCESLDGSEFTIKCEYDLNLLGEGNYTLKYINLAQCNYFYEIWNNLLTTLYPEFKIDDSNMIANSDSSIIFISDMNLTDIIVDNIMIELITGIVPSSIQSYSFIKNDYNITFLFDLSNKNALTNIEGVYHLIYNITKDGEKKEYHDNIVVKQECDREKALVNNGKGECKYCIDKNKEYPFFDYNSRNEIDSKRCISKCLSSQVSYNNICFDECLNAEKFVTGDINNYIVINNGSCFLFNLESITTEVANLDNQELNLTFNLNDIIDINYFSIISIGNYKSKSCVSTVNKILTCIFNFSEIKDNSITLNVSFTLNNNVVMKTNKKVTIKKSIAIDICNSLIRYFNSEKKNNYCKCRTNQFDENDQCVKICSLSYYDEDQKCLSECNNYILYEEINLTNHKQCLKSCPNGYDVNTDTKVCTCHKKLIGNQCLNLVDSNPLRSVSPKFSQAIDLVEFNFTFNDEINTSHRVEHFYLIKDNLQINGFNCTHEDKSLYYICLFNLSEVKSDTTFEIYYNKSRIYKSLLQSLITVQIYKVCSGLNVRNEYDSYNCISCKEKNLETPYFQYYNCVESCDNDTYYRSAIYDYYCVNCKDEGTYLYKEENRCVLDCYELEDKENYEKKKLCVKRTPICPDNYCQNNGQCYVVNKTLTCDCHSLYYGDFCEYSVDSSNIKNLYSVFEDTSLLINNEENLIYNQTIFEFAQSMRILKQLSTSDDENEKEMGIEMFNENENFLKEIEQYTNTMIEKIINEELSIKTDTDIKSVITLSSASIFYLTRMIKPELLTNKTSNLRNLDTTELQNELINLLENINKVNNKLFLTYEDIIINSSTFFQVSEDNMTFFAIWSSDTTSTSNYKITSLSLDIPILEHDIDTNAPIYYYVETAFSKDVLYSLNKDSGSMNAYFTMYNSSLIETSIPNSKISFPLNTNLYSNLNESAIEFYNKRGIDPYNKSDLAFTEICYRSINFDYDLTQEYRREKVYTGISLKSISDSCIYSSYNLREKRLVLICNKLNKDSVGYELKEDPIEKQKVQTLPIKCGKKFKGIKENIAIWLFFSLSFVFIIGIIFLCTTNQKEYLSKALNNDDIAILEDIGKKISTTERGSDTKLEEVYLDLNKKKFINYFIKNFGILHPLFTICSPSVLCPLYYSLTIFFNEIINILGFNAVFFNEDKIEKRIYDNSRNNFIYPMKNEFDKIFCSILTTILSTFILKLLNLTTKNERDILKERIKEDRNEEIISKKGKLRFTGYIIMTFFWVFFWYYCSIFCSMYVNAQYDWLYSSIWSLLLIYFIFAPCCIIIISILDIFKFETISYYLKRLFIF